MSVEHIIVSENEFESWDENEQKFYYNYPSNFYCVNALSERVFFKTRSRAKAQEACDKLYGKGHYVIHAVKDQKTNNPITVRGTATR